MLRYMYVNKGVLKAKYNTINLCESHELSLYKKKFTFRSQNSNGLKEQANIYTRMAHKVYIFIFASMIHISHTSILSI